MSTGAPIRLSARDLKLTLKALSDAIDWQHSLEDAYSFTGSEANKADRRGRAYKKLRAKVSAVLLEAKR